MHDAVAVVVGAQGELEWVPGVVYPLVRQHVQVIHSGGEDEEINSIFLVCCNLPHILVPISSGVCVEESHVVEQLVGDNSHSVSIIGRETGQDPQS